MTEIETAKKRLETTRYLQFQISESHKEIETIEDEISTMNNCSVSGSKLKEAEDRLQYWKGRRDTLQEIWKFRNK